MPDKKQEYDAIYKALFGRRDNAHPFNIFSAYSPVPSGSVPLSSLFGGGSPVPSVPLPSSPFRRGSLRAALLRGAKKLALKDDLAERVKEIFRAQWETREGEVVPEPEDLKLGNDGVELDATVLYADLSGSTSLVDNESARFAAEVYKSYLACAAPIIKEEGGVITAYDGDRIMGVFIGKSKNTSAVTAGLKINDAVSNIINPALKSQYSTKDYVVRHVVGIDASKLLVCRIGVRNDNDLVWVGRAANYAAKLSSLSSEYQVYITEAVFERLNESVKKPDMWISLRWEQMGNITVYGTTWIYKM